MKKILITGASGFLGWHLCHALKEDFEVHALYYRQNFDLEGQHWHRLNLLEEKKIKPFVEQLQPELIIHLAAIANANFCEEHPALSHHINVYSTITLAEVAEALEIPLMFSSTDLVFNGNGGPYAEDDFPYPLSVYGEQKLAAEEALLSDFEDTMVFRLPLLFGWGPDYSKNFFKQWVNALKNGEEITAFEDEYRTPISGAEAARGIRLAMNYFMENRHQEGSFERLFHLAGTELISRYDFANLISRLFELDDSLILTKLRADLPMAAARPKDVGLDSSLAETLLQFKALVLETQIENLKKEMS
jgi:dTDP-4-dehydrorhamnose reductase